MFGIQIKICLLLTWLNSADLQATGCDPGQVRDLDGTCVKKVTFPPRGERKRCPEPRVLNGNHFFGADGRSVNFFCETDHILVPENRVLICRITGEWSKEIPVCLSPGCQIPVSPLHGWLDLDYEDTLAIFYCDTGYQLQGSQYLGCENGETWNSSVPICHKIIKPTTPKPGGRHLVHSSVSKTGSAATCTLIIVLGAAFFLR
ncbi:membrane cofactor protein [Eurytemora carolleeae]|uniref:membrane cofactor protein n=1 Tax=Eurytemora carolleeae TaxID=1294199 RepID=UPI000C783230|nr:membrane cofactor protein [Eurytemora carolleeae]|eukprot:XP_023324557.1 membrane cofactor protein-like [Eurytemora affinis]